VICRSKYSTFSSAVIYKKTVVARLFPDVIKSKSRRNLRLIRAKSLMGLISRICRDGMIPVRLRNLTSHMLGGGYWLRLADKKSHQRHKDKIDRIKSDKRRRVKSVEVKPTEDQHTV